jgi:hypothetical protein
LTVAIPWLREGPERLIGFFNAYRNAERVTRNRLRDIAQQFQNWLNNRCENGASLFWMHLRAGAMILRSLLKQAVSEMRSGASWLATNGYPLVNGIQGLSRSRLSSRVSKSVGHLGSKCLNKWTKQPKSPLLRPHLFIVRI